MKRFVDTVLATLVMVAAILSVVVAAESCSPRHRNPYMRTPSHVTP